jgi:hypothetical protein
MRQALYGQFKMSDKNTTPNTDAATRDDFGRAVRLLGRFYALLLGVAVVVYGLGYILFRGSPVMYLVYLVLAGIVAFGVTSLQRPLKPVYLLGEDDDWYYLLGWDQKIVGFVHAGGFGVKRIPMLQEAVKWKRVTPLLIVDQFAAHTRVHDTFDVHVKTIFEIHPDWVQTTKNARWLIENYPDEMINTAKAIIKDLVQAEMRQVELFSDATEAATEQRLRDTIHRAFDMWQPYGVYINEDVSHVDIMVAQDVRRKRVDARAELSRIQIIRDVARDMGITTDELLIQRALERLPDSRSRQSVGEIAAVLQMLRQQMPVEKLPDHHPPDDTPSEPEIRVEDSSGAEQRPLVHSTDVNEEKPASYVEGYYEPVDDYDPDRDGDGPTGIHSPF